MANQVMVNYRHDDDDLRGALSCRFQCSIPICGTFSLREHSGSSTAETLVRQIPEVRYPCVLHLCVLLGMLQTCLRVRISPEPTNFPRTDVPLAKLVIRNRQRLLHTFKVRVVLTSLWIRTDSSYKVLREAIGGFAAGNFNPDILQIWTSQQMTNTDNPGR
jgi:hypothetical protein